jgi:hypothetical protein
VNVITWRADRGMGRDFIATERKLSQPQGQVVGHVNKLMKAHWWLYVENDFVSLIAL